MFSRIHVNLITSSRETRFSRVHEAKTKLVVDLIHLLAGKTLNFDVKVTDIKRLRPDKLRLFVSRRKKSPAWESQPGHNKRRSLVLTNRVRFVPMSLD